jgi:hypothetical protein
LLKTRIVYEFTKLGTKLGWQYRSYFPYYGLLSSIDFLPNLSPTNS